MYRFNLSYLTLMLVVVLIPFTTMGFELIAHRGIYQNYGREDVDSFKCTATKILPPTHSYIENTIPSIKRAFDIGADIVELDVHPTTELNSKNDRLVVFHDWELTCRTNASCESGCDCNEKQLQLKNLWASTETGKSPSL